MSRQFKLCKTSLDKISKWIKSSEITDEEFIDKFTKTVYSDVKNIKECAEKSIVEFYIESAQTLMFDAKKSMDPSTDEFWEKLKMSTRKKLVKKYVSNKTFDNNIDTYFNDVKREYIMHPQNESEELEFIPENKDVFIKNNLKLVIDCAKRYQGLGLPFEDLIQIGNIGLLMAFDKFDSERANLRMDIIKDIKNSLKESFTFDEAVELIKRNFKYSKLLESTINKIPEEGFSSNNDFIEWANVNIKKASFSSISFAWIRAMIIVELNRYSKVVYVPKTSEKMTEENPVLTSSVNIVRLDSINPHTNDNYSDGQMSDIANEEFAVEDESMERIERNNLFKELIEKMLTRLQPIDRRILKKKYGIGAPFPMSISEIANNEGISQNKVKYSISNSMKIIAAHIPEQDRLTICEMLKG